MENNMETTPVEKVKTEQVQPAGRNTAGDQARTKLAAILLLVLICAAAGFGGGYLGSKNQMQDTGGTPVISKANQQSILNESQLINAIAKNVSPSVVSVDVISQAAAAPDLFGFATGGGQQRSAGTGIIISDDGYIVTNRHVVPSGSSTISVTLSDGTQLDDVQVVGRTNESDSLDIAILKIKDAKGKKLQKATLGDSAKVQVGDKAVAIGNALGQFQNTVTDGIISGFGRSVQASDGSGGGGETLQNLLQTDAAINEGNSGGPLVNISGEVIGINTAIAGQGAQNIGFAIPINDVQGLIKTVLNKGVFERPYLGVRYVTLTDDYAYQFNLQVKRGAYIVPSNGRSASILPDSPAAKAGLKEKDIITKIDGTDINEKNSLTSLVGRKSVGDTVKLTILRDGGKEQMLDVKLEPAPKQ